MKRLSWSHEDISSKYADIGSLTELVSKIEGELKTEQTFVTKVIVNGLPLTEMEEGRYAQSQLAEIQLLEVEVSKVDEILDEAIRSSVLLGSSLQGLAVQTADLMRSDDLHEAHKSFTFLLNEVENLITAYQLVEEVLKVRGEKLKTGPHVFMKRFNNLLGDLLSSYQKRDFILTADQLEYELTKCLSEVSQIEVIVDR